MRSSKGSRGPLSPNSKNVGRNRKSPFKGAEPPVEARELNLEEEEVQPEAPGKREEEKQEEVPKQPTRQMIDRYNKVRDELEKRRQVKAVLERQKEELLMARNPEVYEQEECEPHDE